MPSTESVRLCIFCGQKKFQIIFVASSTRNIENGPLSWPTVIEVAAGPSELYHCTSNKEHGPDDEGHVAVPANRWLGDRAGSGGLDLQQRPTLLCKVVYRRHHAKCPGACCRQHNDDFLHKQRQHPTAHGNDSRHDVSNGQMGDQEGRLMNSNDEKHEDEKSENSPNQKYPDIEETHDGEAAGQSSTNSNASRCQFEMRRRCNCQLFVSNGEGNYTCNHKTRHEEHNLKVAIAEEAGEEAADQAEGVDENPGRGPEALAVRQCARSQLCSL